MQGWFHGHGIFYTVSGMKFEGTVANQIDGITSRPRPLFLIKPLRFRRVSRGSYLGKRPFDLQ